MHDYTYIKALMDRLLNSKYVSRDDIHLILDWIDGDRDHTVGTLENLYKQSLADAEREIAEDREAEEDSEEGPTLERDIDSVW